MKNIGKNAVELEGLVFRLGQLVCSTHHIMMEVQQKLLMVYMQARVMNRPAKERKIQLCHNILKYLEKTNPHDKSSRKYLVIRSCLVETKFETMAQDYKEGKVDKNRLAKVICEKQALMVMSSLNSHNK